MVIGILVVVWIAVLTPIALRHFRDRDTNRSIVSFHSRLAHLQPEAPIVAPAHRLSEAEPTVVRAAPDPAPTPRLRLVPPGAEPAELDREMSWDDWSRAYADDPETPAAPAAAPLRAASRATAYARVPQVSEIAVLADTTPMRWGASQRQRRRRVIIGLGASTALSTLLFIMVNSIVVDLWAAVSWVAVAGYLGLMYYAMNAGLLRVSSSREVREPDDSEPSYDFDGYPIEADERYVQAQ